jgi:hypothetical protein
MLSSVASSFLRNGATKSAVTRTAARAQFAYFSSGSHDDFAPQRQVVEGEDEAIKLIKVCYVCAFSV